MHAHQPHDHSAMLAAHAAQSGGPTASQGGFFSNLFEVFTPRQQCMNYEPDVVWMHIVSDTMIALAYFSIPIALIYFVRRRKDLAFNWMFVLFAAFILACGTTHIFGLIAIWRPYYRMDGIVKLFTGLVSVATAVLLWPLVNKALLLPSPAQLRLANETLEREVAERKRAEADTQLAREDLERRVKERTAELQAASEQRSAALAAERAARAEAERSGRIKDEFVATLSHELRTPISSILGWTHLLRANPSRPDALHGLEVIERNTRAQARMIEDLLDMSRIVAGKLRLDIQSVDLSTVVNAALETVAPAAQARGVRLTSTLDPSAGPLRGDPARLQQIVWNLLSNAIKFTPRDGTVHIALARVSSHVQIVVTDTGKGIGAAFLPHVFDRFRQEDSSTTRAHGGLGIGLSIARHLTEMHGGTISVHSDGEGHGATFTVSLPIATAGSDAPANTAATPASLAPPTPSRTNTLPTSSELSGLRILVVDDEPDTRELLTHVLTQAGAQVQTAGSAAEAYQAALASPPDLLLSDIGMPEEDGYALIRRIRQLPGGTGTPARLPAIALTAFARSEDRTRALVAGFQAHLAKPVEPDELVATVASIAGRLGPR